MREIIQNDSSSPLNGAINGTVTSIVVDDGNRFPGSGQYRIIVDQEIMLVTSRSLHTLTVTRGYESTVAASHLDNAPVKMVLTEGVLKDYIRSEVPNFQGNPVAPPFGHLTDKAGTALTAASFAWVNQDSSTLADRNGGLFFRQSADGSSQVNLFKKAAPSTPYTVDIAARALYVGSLDIEPGVLFRESATGKLIHLTFWSDAGNKELAVFRYTNETTFTSTATTPHADLPAIQWYRLEDDGTDLFFYVSVNGIDWLQIHTEARGSFFTTAPNEVGIGTVNRNSSFDVLMDIFAWHES